MGGVPPFGQRAPRGRLETRFQRNTTVWAVLTLASPLLARLPEPRTRTPSSTSAPRGSASRTTSLTSAAPSRYLPGDSRGEVVFVIGRGVLWHSPSITCTRQSLPSVVHFRHIARHRKLELCALSQAVREIYVSHVPAFIAEGKKYFEGAPSKARRRQPSTRPAAQPLAVGRTRDHLPRLPGRTSPRRRHSRPSPRTFGLPAPPSRS